MPQPLDQLQRPQLHLGELIVGRPADHFDGDFHAARRFGVPNVAELAAANALDELVAFLDRQKLARRRRAQVSGRRVRFGLRPRGEWLARSLRRVRRLGRRVVERTGGFRIGGLRKHPLSVTNCLGKRFA